VEHIVARPCLSEGYELLDSEGKYVGWAPTAAHARRFADATGAPVEFEGDAAVQAATAAAAFGARSNWRHLVLSLFSGRSSSPQERV
jgi:hypothetical protein